MTPGLKWLKSDARSFAQVSRVRFEVEVAEGMEE